MSQDDLMMDVGRNFVEYITKQGYHNFISVLGADLRDFLNSKFILHISSKVNLY